MNAPGAAVVGARRVEPARFGVWLFLLTEAMFFAALISAFLVLRAGAARFGSAAGALDVRLGVLATIMLAVASLCASRARVASRREGDQGRVSSWVRRTILFGALFLVLQGLEYRSLLAHGIAPRSSLYWSSFFLLTSVHALHVAAGIAWMIALRHGGRRLGVELAALYWHLVGVVWVTLFALLY